MSQVAVGSRTQLKVFGDDWPNPNVKGVRDYIHLMDLAEGHRAALDFLLAEALQLLTLNLRSGHGQPVLKLLQAMEAPSDSFISHAITDRRSSDDAISFADSIQSAQYLNADT